MGQCKPEGRPYCPSSDKTLRYLSFHFHIIREREGEATTTCRPDFTCYVFRSLLHPY